MDKPEEAQADTKNSRKLALRVLKGPDEGCVFPLIEGFIGSKSSVDIHLSDPTISALHARISLRRDIWHITDLTSSPDIRVNNAIAKSRKIQFGDTIAIGGTTLQVIMAPDDLLKPRKWETGKMPDIPKDLPSSQTMELTIDSGAADWKPGKPKDQPALNTHTQPPKSTSSPSPNAKHMGEQKRSSSNVYTRQPMPEQKNSRFALFLVILLAVLVPALIAGIIVSQKKQAKRELAATFANAELFEQNNPGKYQEIIQLYRNLHMSAAGSHNSLALLAEENIRRLENAALKDKTDLESIVARLDERSGQLAKEGDAMQAAAVYENYTGRFSDELHELRKSEIARLKNLAVAKTEHSPTLNPGELIASTPTPTALPKLPPTPGPASTTINTMLSAAVDSMISGDLDSAEAELQKLTEASSSPTDQLAAKSGILLIKQLKDAEELVQKSGAGESRSFDAAEDRSQPVMVRLICFLRKNDLLSAHLLSRQLDNSALARALAGKAHMSDQALAKENSLISKFGEIWFSLIPSANRTVPRPAECMDILKNNEASLKPEALLKFCQAMIKLQADNQESLFTVRYADVFDICKAKHLQLAGKSIMHSGAGNAVVIEIENNLCFFETSGPLPSAQSAKVGLIKQNQVFFTPGTSNAVAALVDILHPVNFRKVTDMQGVFDIPAVLKTSRPSKRDRLLIEDNLTESARILPLRQINPASRIYTADFSKPLGKEWVTTLERRKGRGGDQSSNIMTTEKGRLIMNMSGADIRCAAGRADYEFRSNMGLEPLEIRFTVTVDTNSDFVLVLDKVQFAFTEKPNRKPGTFFNGRRTSTFNTPPVPHGVPTDVIIQWTPHYSILKVGNTAYPAPVDSSRSGRSLTGIGFAVLGRASISDFTISKCISADDDMIIGISGCRTAVLLTRPETPEWQRLQPGHTVFLKSEIIQGKDKTRTNVTTQIPVKAVFDKHLLLSANQTLSVTRDSKVSLSDRTQTDNSISESIPYLPAAGWNPPIFIGRLITNQGAFAVSPDMAASFGRDGYIGTIASIVAHPHSKEPFLIYPSAARQTVFTEQSGLLMAPAIAEIASMSKSMPVILSAQSPMNRNAIPLLPPFFNLDPASFPQPAGGWSGASGNWTRKLNRLLSPPQSDTPAVIYSQKLLWDNCQFSLDLRIEAESKTNDRNELIIELFSPLWQRSVAISIGSRGSSIDLDLIAKTQKGASQLTTINESLSNNGPQWERGITPQNIALSINKDHKLILRRSGSKFAFYLDGRRIATMNYAGLQGELSLGVACVSGQVSIGLSSGTMLSNLTVIPEKEPPLGEFGYVLAAEGAAIIFDVDSTNISRGDQISIMKEERVITGQSMVTVNLRRIASGTVNEVNHRTAVALTSSILEPIQPGMKVMTGRQPDQLTVTSSPQSGSK